HPDGTVGGGHELYRPHQFTGGSRPISLFFRDHQISDLIGFVYSRMDAGSAAADLYHRLKSAGRSTGARPAVIPVILDGENAWEFFRGNGRDFLKSFYRRVQSDPDLRALTASEALNVTEPGRLEHIVPGSWINANFDVWIGADEDNRAWDLLSQARDFFAEYSTRADVPPEQLELARQELWISEGSDWCWWYGPEHSSAHDAEFDLLYRKHLSNIYRLLGASPPDELAVPIKRPKTQAISVPTSGAIEPRVDGIVTNYFEWLGAGVYVPDNRSGSMHGAAGYIEALYYGYSRDSVYLRVDLSESFREEHPDFEIRVNVDGNSRAHLRARVEAGKFEPAEFSRGADAPAPLRQGGGVSVAYSRIFEFSLSYEALGLKPHEKISLQVSLWVNELPVQVLPQEGWLMLELTEDYIAW
ncbi:MAG: glycoside hydrolase, partial [Deltaproteobacteria bacterium]